MTSIKYEELHTTRLKYTFDTRNNKKTGKLPKISHHGFKNKVQKEEK